VPGSPRGAFVELATYSLRRVATDYQRPPAFEIREHRGHGSAKRRE